MKFSRVQVQLVEKIDSHVLAILADGGNEEDLVLHLDYYFQIYERLMAITPPKQIGILCKQFSGFSRLVKLLGELAKALESGELTLAMIH